MISYIKGTLEFLGEDFIIVENNSIGYEIKIPLSVIPNLPHIREEVKIYTYLYVREDAMLLFGFLSMDDIDVFKKLLSVSGVGPKAALGVLSTITPDDLRYAIICNDDKTIAKAPGIGKKTAQKLILELKDKFNIKDIYRSHKEDYENTNIVNMDNKNEAVEALVTLGYTQTETAKAISGINEYDSTEDLIKKALKILAKY